MGTTVIVDYGSGNVFSVARALETAGASVLLSDAPDTIANADRLVLPGVGAFGAAWNLLVEKNLIEPIRKFIGTERPFLGICVGMQMMMQRSEEFGDHTGLGIIEGVVKKISGTRADGEPHPVPRVGWYTMTRRQASWSGTLFETIDESGAVYFVHSFAAQPSDSRNVLADSEYNGASITAAVIRDNAVGVQFHPEKSGHVGLRMMEKYISL